MTPRAWLGRAVAAGSAVLIPLLLLLPYVSASSGFGGSQSASGWQVLHGSDVLLLLCSIGVVVLLTVDVFVAPSRRLVAAAAALSFVSVGLAWPDLLGLPFSWDAGAYLVLLVALASAAGAVLALTEPLALRPAGRAFGVPSAATTVPSSQPSVPPAADTEREQPPVEESE